MRRAITFSFLLVLAACGRDLELPGEPDPQPRITAVSPVVAVVALDTQLELRGTGLDAVEQLTVGPVTVGPAFLDSVAADRLVFRIPADAERRFDGSAQAVRVVAPGGEAVAPEAVRVFEARTIIANVAPREVAPGQLIYLRGLHFDTVETSQNHVMLVSEDDPRALAQAGTISATGSVVLAVLPQNAPAGRVRVRFHNGALSALDAPDAAESVGDAVRVEGMDDEILVWKAIGPISLEPPQAQPGEPVSVVGSTRLLYQDASGALAPGLQVLLDGVPVLDVGPEVGDDPPVERLRFTVPSSAAVGAGRVVQVSTPFHVSPAASLTVCATAGVPPCD